MFFKCVVCCEQRDALKDITETGNGDLGFLSRVKMTVFRVVPREHWGPSSLRQEEVLSPSR